MAGYAPAALCQLAEVGKMEEVWKDIEGYEGLYKISNYGRIYSFHTNKYMQGRLNNKGYRHVCLSKNKKMNDFQVHRLVAYAFIENNNNFPLVNHKDENVLNNHADNLEWCTNTYNVRYSLERHPERKRKTHTKKLIMYDKDMNVLNVFDLLSSVCKEKNWNSWSIIQCCNGKRRTAYGYKWGFAK
jgi:hypothetical protein